MARTENNGSGKVTTMPAGRELKLALPKHKKQEETVLMLLKPKRRKRG